MSDLNEQAKTLLEEARQSDIKLPKVSAHHPLTSYREYTIVHRFKKLKTSGIDKRQLYIAHRQVDYRPMMSHKVAPFHVCCCLVSGVDGIYFALTAIS